MKCKKCSTEFTEGIFCPMCGTKNEEAIIGQEEVMAIEKKEREKAEEVATAAANKKIEQQKEIIRNNGEKNAREEAVKAAQQKARQNISSDDEDIKSEALKRVREEAIQNAKLEEKMKQQEEAERKVKEERRINRKAIISLILGIASWVGMLTVILPIVGGIWAIVDGCKALKGKTKYKKSAIFGIILPILFYVLLIIVTVQDIVSSSKRDAQLNSYIENGQYAEAQEYIAQEYSIGSASYVEKCIELYELQGMYDEVVDLWVEYCSSEYEPIDIPDFRINKLNEYLDKYGTDLKPETIEKVHNLINSKEVAKEAKEAEEQAAKKAKEAEEQTAKETKGTEETAEGNGLEFDVKNEESASIVTKKEIGNLVNKHKVEMQQYIQQYYGDDESIELIHVGDTIRRVWKDSITGEEYDVYTDTKILDVGIEYMSDDNVDKRYIDYHKAAVSPVIYYVTVEIENFSRENFSSEVTNEQGGILDRMYASKYGDTDSSNLIDMYYEPLDTVQNTYNSYPTEIKKGEKGKYTFAGYVLDDGKEDITITIMDDIDILFRVGETWVYDGVENNYPETHYYGGQAAKHEDYVDNTILPGTYRSSTSDIVIEVHEDNTVDLYSTDWDIEFYGKKIEPNRYESVYDHIVEFADESKNRNEIFYFDFYKEDDSICIFVESYWGHFPKDSYQLVEN